MRISPINFISGLISQSQTNFGKNQIKGSCVARDYVPTTVRHNSLSDNNLVEYFEL